MVSTASGRPPNEEERSVKSRRFPNPLLASDGGAGGWRAGKAPRLLLLPSWNQGMVQKVAHPALDVVGVPAGEQAGREGRVGRIKEQKVLISWKNWQFVRFRILNLLQRV